MLDSEEQEEENEGKKMNTRIRSMKVMMRRKCLTKREGRRKKKWKKATKCPGV
jgi:hypothetical protein